MSSPQPPSTEASRHRSSTTRAALARILLLRAAHVLPGDDLPGVALSNQDLSALMERLRDALAQGPTPRVIEISSPDFPEERVGIRSRRVLDGSLSTRDMALAAGRKVLAGGVDPSRIRALLVSSVTPDKVVPSLASTLQHELGLSPHLQALDLSVGCSGFVVALETGARLLSTHPPGSLALVVGADAMTRVLDASDRSTCTIFGDGAGAVLLAHQDEEEAPPREAWRFRSAETFTMGAKGGAIEIRNHPELPDPVWRFTARDGRPDLVLDDVSRHCVLMQGRAVFKDMVNLVPERVLAHLGDQGLVPGDIDAWLFHQANLRMLEAIARRLDLRPETLRCNIERLGNTTSGSVPILLSEEWEAGRLPGKRILLAGFGTGYSMGLVVLERADLEGREPA